MGFIEFVTHHRLHHRLQFVPIHRACETVACCFSDQVRTQRNHVLCVCTCVFVCVTHAGPEQDVIVGFVCGTCSRESRLTHASMSTHEPDGVLLCVHSVVVRGDLRRQGIATRMLKVSCSYGHMHQHIHQHARIRQRIQQQASWWVGNCPHPTVAVLSHLLSESVYSLLLRCRRHMLHFCVPWAFA